MPLIKYGSLEGQLAVILGISVAGFWGEVRGKGHEQLSFWHPAAQQRHSQGQDRKLNCFFSALKLLQ